MIAAKAIIPKNKFKPEVFRTEAVKAMEEAAKGITADFEKTTATWKHQPEFKSAVDIGKTVNLVVGTTDEIYGYVDKGTRPHIIRPKKAKALAFPGGKYTPKTKPRFIGSMAGGSSGATVFSQEIHHPGTKARKFTEELFKRWRNRIYDSVSKAFSRAAKLSGHSMK